MTKAETKEYNRAYYLKNRAKLLNDVKTYRLANLEQVRAKARKMAKRDKEINNLRARLWYQDNKQLMKDRAKEWKRNNPETVRATTRSYASRRQNAVGSFTSKDYIKLKNNLNGLCGYCGNNEANTIDHVIPLSRGGTNYIGNIMPACGACNYSKQCKTIVEWKYGKAVCTRTVRELQNV